MSAGEDDGAEKTEDASQKKIDDALAKGQTPASREPAVLVSLLVFAMWFAFAAGPVTAETAAHLRHLLDEAGTRPVTFALVHTMMANTAAAAGTALAPLLIALMVGGLVAGMAQARPRLVAERIRPQFSRVSLSKGWVRTFGKKGWFEFAKSVAKLAVAGIAAFVVLRSALPTIVEFMLRPPMLLLGDTSELVLAVTFSICLVMGVIAVADLAWSRHTWRDGLKMTKKEVTDETKQSEGDPILKSRRRSLAQDRSRRRMMDAVPGATLVLANPTHVAVALRYRHEEDAAPVVVAKGGDVLCARIKEIAAENDVPILERVELARAIYKVGEVDRPIPAEFYKAVAEIINFVMDPARAR